MKDEHLVRASGRAESPCWEADMTDRCSPFTFNCLWPKGELRWCLVFTSQLAPCTRPNSSPGPPAAGCPSISAHTGTRQKRKWHAYKQHPLRPTGRTAPCCFVTVQSYLHSTCSVKTPEYPPSSSPALILSPEWTQASSDLITAGMQRHDRVFPKPYASPTSGPAH